MRTIMAVMINHPYILIAPPGTINYENFWEPTRTTEKLLWAHIIIIVIIPVVILLIL